MNTNNNGKVGRPVKDDSKKRRKFGSTIHPMLAEIADSYRDQHGQMEVSEFLDHAIHTLLLKECEAYRRNPVK